MASSQSNESSGYVPEYVHFSKLLQKSAPELLQQLIAIPQYLQNKSYQKLRDRKATNFVISPLMIELILIALKFGSSGETELEIERSVRHQDLGRQELKRTCKALIYVLKEYEIFRFFPVHKMFVRSQHTINRNFKILSEGVFDLFVESLNFREPVKATNKINNWMKNQTVTTLHNAVPFDVLTDSCKVVIVSSTYFTAIWHVDVIKELTAKKSFYKDGEEVEAEFMQALSSYNYYESEDLQAKYLELQLVEEEGSLVIVLPYQKDGLPYLEDRIEDALTLPNSVFTRTEVRAEVPKYIISTTLDWKHVLQGLGIEKLFTEGEAEISDIAGEALDLHLNHFFQKIIIRIDEKGIETNTLFFGQKKDPLPSPSSETAKQFIANHPFLFYVKIRGVIVFIGRLVDPSHPDEVI